MKWISWIVIAVLGSIFPGRVQAEIHIVLEAFPSVVIKSGPRYASEFMVYYGAYYDAATDDPCSVFPATAYGGQLSGCAAYAPEGVAVEFTDVVEWFGAWVTGDAEDVESVSPADVQVGSLHPLDPFSASSFRYVSAKLAKLTYNGRVTFLSDFLQCFPDYTSDLDNPWTVSVCVDFRATYEDAEGAVLGTSLASDFGFSPVCAQLEFPKLFWIASTTAKSWGALRALY